ncbi:phage tail protein [Herbaspirillum robiniae]|uniref:phage tail protein n=1 Tax=Herbaspirillum robiniae TaxID=2014887 RepID=UPI0009A1A71B|nr:phage tail protein [Herbaspirillum robiniae]
MMMVLGMFVFSLPTLAYQELQRQTQWKFASNPRVGLRDAKQYTGKGEDTITLSGWIAPELTGSAFSLDALRLMADTGKSWFLIQGTGRIYGSFVIDSMEEGLTELDGDGDPKKISFTIKLTRTDDSVLSALGLGDISDLRNMMDIDGITNSIADKARNVVGSAIDGVRSTVGGIVGKFSGGSQ